MSPPSEDLTRMDVTRMDLTRVDLARVTQARQAWDEQQRAYTPWRDERWAVAIEVLMAMPPGVVVDVGCGPGTLTASLASALRASDRRGPHQLGPHQRGPDEHGPDEHGPNERGNDERGHDERGHDSRWRVVGLEADGFLLELAGTDTAPVTWVQGRRLADVPPGLFPLRAVVSSAVMHYLPAPGLTDVYREALAAVGPEGVVITIEELPDPGCLIDTPAGPSPWAAWWDAVAQDPTLRQLRDRHAVPTWPDAGEPLTLAEHLDCVRAAGGEGDLVWRQGSSAVLVIRASARV